LARTDLPSCTNRAPSARPAPTFSTAEEAHTGLIELLAVLKPYRILYIADARDLAERAEHLQQILGAVLDYVGAIVVDTSHPPPAGRSSESTIWARSPMSRRCCRLPPLGTTVLRWMNAAITYFPGFLWIRLRSLTPGPPPFSSMNRMPAASRTPFILESVSGSPAYRPTSRFVIVLRCKPVASARSRTVHSRAARAMRTCALVTVIFIVLLSHVSMTHVSNTKGEICHG
jgi:hypothetical protein